MIEQHRFKLRAAAGKAEGGKDEEGHSGQDRQHDPDYAKGHRHQADHEIDRLHARKVRRRVMACLVPEIANDARITDGATG